MDIDFTDSANNALKLLNESDIVELTVESLGELMKGSQNKLPEQANKLLKEINKISKGGF